MKRRRQCQRTRMCARCAPEVEQYSLCAELGRTAGQDGDGVFAAGLATVSDVNHSRERGFAGGPALIAERTGLSRREQCDSMPCASDAKRLDVNLSNSMVQCWCMPIPAWTLIDL
jgi:hypothetical protein